MKHLISRRNFLKAAGVTTAAAAMAVCRPAGCVCLLDRCKNAEVTILYTNDVHTYIDKQVPGADLCGHCRPEAELSERRANRSCWWTPVTMCRAPLTAPWTRALPSLS